MSLKANILFNYVAQIYVTLIGLAFIPMYLKYMGAEAYGLIGFFAMLQAWFLLLDMGLTPTIGRETARFQGGSLGALAFRRLFRALNVIFHSISIIGGGLLFLLAEPITNKWLNVDNLATKDAVFAIQIMAIITAIRWLYGLRKGVLLGAEQFMWLSKFSILSATLRSVLVLPIMYIYGFTADVFFIHQLVTTLIEIIVLHWRSEQFLALANVPVHTIGWSFRPVQSVLKFSLGIAIAGAIWVSVTQTDKLVLSGILSLHDYGIFSLSVLVAGGILAIAAPVSNALMPRLARLHAENQHNELLSVYKNATQLVAIVTGSVSITLASAPLATLYAWTGDHLLAAQAAPVLALYAVGNGVLSIGAFPYYLQYAQGKLAYHVIGNLGLVSIMLPTIVWAASTRGAIGAGLVWLSMNLLYLVFWVAYVHHKISPNLHLGWIFNDVIKIIVPMTATALGFQYLLQSPESRLGSGAYIAMLAALVLSIGVLSSNLLWDKLKSR